MCKMKTNIIMKSLHKLYTSVLALLLLMAGAGQAEAAVNSDLQNKYISGIGNAVTSLTNGQWYLVRSVKNNAKYLSDPGNGNLGTESALAVNADASANAGQLFQITSSSIVSGDGRYLKLSASNSSTSFSTSSSSISVFQSSTNTRFIARSTDKKGNNYRYLYLNSSSVFAGNSAGNTISSTNYYLEFLPVTLASKTEPNFGGWTNGSPVVGSTMQLGIWGMEFSQLVLTSEDPSIATVNASGLVTGVSAGTTNIVLTCPESAVYSEKVVKIPVTVDRKTIYNANASVSAYQVEVGETIRMTVTSESDGVVTFSSSDQSIATVNASGVITGVAPGQVTISYAIGESNTYNAFAGGSQTINVIAASVKTGVYYIMDKASGKFLTRGKNYGYRSLANPYGLPWYVVRQDNGTYKMYMYDMYKNGVTTKGLGTNGYVDNTTPANWTITGTLSECTIAANNAFLAVNADGTIAPQSATAGKWEFLSASAYQAKVAELQQSQELSVAESQSFVLGSSSLTAYLTANRFEETDYTSKMQSMPTNGGKWVLTLDNGNANYGTYGTELYQSNGTYTQQVTGLTPGVYKVRIKALKRAATNAVCKTIGDEGYPLSDAYLWANGQTVNIKDWYSGRGSDTNPNTTGEFLTRLQAGQYVSEVYTTVGSNGILDLKVVSDASQGYSWFCFNSVELFYMKDTRRTPATLTLTPSTLTLEAGTSAAVTLNFGDWDGVASNITHTTPTASVATIAGSGTSYMVNAVGKGQTKVTFTLPETSKHSTTTAELTINVGLAATNLSFAISSLELPIDGTATHKATTTSASTGAITYSSSNTAVATVDALTGLVTAKKLGTATITATLAETNQFASATATYSLSVTRKQTLLQFRNVTNNTLSLLWGQDVKAGDTFNNAATTNSSSPVQYSSDNLEVVSVDANGILTFHGVGTATVTASVAQNDVYQAAEARCYVSITDQNYYRLTLVNAPERGVLVTIGSKTFTGNADFTFSGVITPSMVKVASLSSYSTSVDVSLVDEGNSAVNPHVITVTYTLVPPTAGRFYRISSYNNHSYLSCKASSASGHSQNLALTKSQDSNVLVYVDADNHLLFYGNGQYMSADGQLVEVGSGTGAAVSFHSADAVNSGAFAIKSGSLYMRDASSYVEFDSKSVTGASDWSVEQVNTLPVTLSNAGYGYATLFCPVALQVPGGVSAFSIQQMVGPSSDDRDYTLQLERIVSIIPAGTPVVLQGMPGATYEFPLLYSNTDAPLSSAPGVTGSAPSLLTSVVEASGSVFTLQPTANTIGVGFYPWQSSHSSGTYPQAVIQGFRAYILYGGSNVNSFHFQFEDEQGNATSIEGFGSDAASNEAYDLLGRKMEQGAKGLMFLQGRKILVK